MKNTLLVICTALAVAFASQPLWLFGKAAYDMQFWSAVGVCAFMAVFLTAGAAHFVWEEWR
jgi:hypothetical protein